MAIQATIDGDKAIIEVDGKITVQTAPDLEDAVSQVPESVCNFDIDLGAVDYVSSAGLRVFVTADQLAITRGGIMRLLHPADEVMEVLDMTGLSDVLTIEH
jgi:anti-sigma B factor antagonist